MEKKIGMRQDGMNMVFTPGKGGSLTARKMTPQPQNPLDYRPKKRAKVINAGRMNVAMSLSGGSGY